MFRKGNLLYGDMPISNGVEIEVKLNPNTLSVSLKAHSSESFSQATDRGSREFPETHRASSTMSSPSSFGRMKIFAHPTKLINYP